MMLGELRHEVWCMNLALPKNGLVTWTSGNVSGLDRQSGLVVIKPSGVMFEDLRPEDLTVVDLEGRIVEGRLKPSVDAATHLYVYRHRPDVGGMVHTHSPYATAFAALGRPIPVYLTAMADEFGMAVPVGAYAQIDQRRAGAVGMHGAEDDAVRAARAGLVKLGRLVQSDDQHACDGHVTERRVDVVPGEPAQYANDEQEQQYQQSPAQAPHAGGTFPRIRPPAFAHVALSRWLR